MTQTDNQNICGLTNRLIVAAVQILVGAFFQYDWTQTFFLSYLHIDNKGLYHPKMSVMSDVMLFEHPDRLYDSLATCGCLA